MTVDVSTVLTVITGAGAAVGSVGVAVTSVKVLTSSFKHYREAMGYSVKESMLRVRADQQALARQQMSSADREAAKDAEVAAMAADPDRARLRQMEKEYEQMWAEQSRREG